LLSVGVVRSFERGSEATDEGYEGEVTETIDWQTIESWKGRLSADSAFTTVKTAWVSDRHPRPSWRPGGSYGEGPWLLFLYGQEPFGSFDAYQLQDSERIVRFLERRRRR